MTAKNPELIKDWLLLQHARLLRREGLLSKQEFYQVKQQLNLPRSSYNILVRAGFFLLGAMLYSSILGSITFFLPGQNINYPQLMLAFSAIGLIIAEVLCYSKFHNYGLDDAFIILFQLIFCAAAGAITASPIVVFVLLFILGAICSYRYFNTTSIIFSLIGFASLLSSAVTVYHILHPLALPFIMFFGAILIYGVYLRYRNHHGLYLYQRSLKAIKLFALCLGYLALNFAIVSELYRDLNQIKSTIFFLPFGFVFWFFTGAIPVFYLWYGLKKKDRLFLHIGILSLFISGCTLVFYSKAVTAEIALIFGGLAASSCAVFAMQRLAKKNTGVTTCPTIGLNEKPDDLLGLLTATSAQLTGSEQTNAKFGGGGFTGGGTSGNY